MRNKFQIRDWGLNNITENILMKYLKATLKYIQVTIISKFRKCMHLGNKAIFFSKYLK